MSYGRSRSPIPPPPMPSQQSSAGRRVSRSRSRSPAVNNDRYGDYRGGGGSSRNGYRDRGGGGGGGGRRRSRSRSYDRYRDDRYGNGGGDRYNGGRYGGDRYGGGGGGRGGGPSYEEEDGCRLHVGDLNERCTESDLERAFSRYGELQEVWMARNPPSFAFVVFKSPKDASVALREMDSRTIGSCRVRVTLAKPRTRGRNRWDPEMRCYQCGEKGHFARDCPTQPNGLGGGGGGGGPYRGGGGAGRGAPYGRSRDSGRRYERSYSRERERPSYSRHSRSRSPRREYSNGYY